MSSTLKGKKRVTFSVVAEPSAEVWLLGSFNNWTVRDRILRYDLDRGMHVVSLYLSPGRYEYKFMINGMWCMDPACSQWTLDESGYMNSVIDV
jgi:1,4-alpha-glucan branching enzyme